MNQGNRTRRTWMGWTIGTASAVLALAAFGCAQNTQSEGVPTADSDDLEEHASITNNGWTVNAYTPSQAPYYQISGGAMISRSSGVYTRKAGVCLLREYRNSSNQPVYCNTTTDCANAPAASTLTAVGGAQGYCLKADNDTVKKCWYRPGSRTNYCAGTPATGQLIDLTPPYTGISMWTPEVTEYDTSLKWVSDGCLEGCTATDPSVSSASNTTYVYTSTSSSSGYGCQKCGSVCC